MERDDLVTRGAVAIAVALLVVLASVVAASLLAPGMVDADADASTDGPPSAYRPDAVVAEPIPATGSVEVAEELHAGSYDRKVVVVDADSRVEQEEIRPFVRAVVGAGHEVRFRDGPLNETLPFADAYVRVDPERALTPADLRAVANFTDRGGHLVLVAEPTRREIEVSGLTAQVDTVRTEMVELAAQYGVVFGTRYLYDTTTNDGNYRDVLARPTGAEAASAVDRVALSTATRVSSRNGTVLLRTPASTRLSEDGPARRYPVAVRTGNVLAVGDKTFLSEARHTVADNEVFLAAVVAFALEGDAAMANASDVVGADATTPADTNDSDGSENVSGTPTPVTDGT